MVAAISAGLTGLVEGYAALRSEEPYTWPPCTPPRVEGMRPWLAEVTDALIDRFAGKDQVDIVDEPFPVSAGEAFLRGLSITGLVGEPLRYRDDLLRLITAGRLEPGRIISHRLPLDRIGEAFDLVSTGAAVRAVIELDSAGRGRP